MKPVTIEGKKYVSCPQAGMALGVTAATIRAWFDAGILPGIDTRDKGERRVVLIPEKALKKEVLRAKCLQCGKIFATRNPKGAKFCSKKHNWQWYSENVLVTPRKHPRPRKKRKK